MRILVCIRVDQSTRAIKEVETFSDRQKASRFLAAHGADWEVHHTALDDKADVENKRYWWRRINLETGREYASGKRPLYALAHCQKDCEILLTRNTVEVRSYVSQSHADELARAEAAKNGESTHGD